MTKPLGGANQVDANQPVYGVMQTISGEDVRYELCLGKHVGSNTYEGNTITIIPADAQVPDFKPTVFSLTAKTEDVMAYLESLDCDD